VNILNCDVQLQTQSSRSCSEMDYDSYQTAINNRLSVYSVSLNDLNLRLFFAELLAIR